MHISEGVLSAPILIGGAALALGGVARGLKDVDGERIPKAAILAAMFFTASLIHVKIGPGSAHLVLSGLMGLLLGWAAFPVIAMGLLLQGLLFQFGGLSTLGINTFNMAAPAALLGVICRKGIISQNGVISGLFAFFCGGGSVFISALMVAVCLLWTGSEFTVAARALVLSNLPVIIIEGLITLLCARFLKKVRPELLRHSVLGAEKSAVAQ